MAIINKPFSQLNESFDLSLIIQSDTCREIEISVFIILDIVYTKTELLLKKFNKFLNEGDNKIIVTIFDLAQD